MSDIEHHVQATQLVVGFGADHCARQAAVRKNDTSPRHPRPVPERDRRGAVNVQRHEAPRHYLTTVCLGLRLPSRCQDAADLLSLPDHRVRPRGRPHF